MEQGAEPHPRLSADDKRAPGETGCCLLRSRPNQQNANTTKNKIHANSNYTCITEDSHKCWAICRVGLSLGLRLWPCAHSTHLVIQHNAGEALQPSGPPLQARPRLQRQHSTHLSNHFPLDIL